MSDSDKLAQWLRAQVDEDERVARDALEERWAYSPPLVSYDVVPDDDGHFEMGGEEVETLGFAPEDLTHIARQDPARTLAEVKTKRLIIEAVERYLDPHPGVPCDHAGDPYGPCELHAAAKGRVDPYALRLLALSYAGQPGYREEWRP
jgi:hypothetical protein